MKLLLVLLLCISQAFALEVTPIKKGSPAPKDGFFVTADTMKEFRKINEQKKLLESKNIKLEQLALVKDERIELYKTGLSQTERALRVEHTKGYLKGVGGFIIGVLATSAAAYAAIKVAK